jgi:hypothetical protein
VDHTPPTVELCARFQKVERRADLSRARGLPSRLVIGSAATSFEIVCCGWARFPDGSR